ncbi:MAG: malonate decarboxylase holo-ACP synthase [Alistipes senegalensis]|nr:malonate decarboxylase holo-ACP synthase [Oxalobacter formigenes]MCM1280696.1 malonate decarboxylase holo-ACP synthase [Alistipes senegalensis]
MTEAVQARPHDLLWTGSFSDLFFGEPPPAWVFAQWHPGLPVVVRRDAGRKGLIPVGIRGRARSERAAAWLLPEGVKCVVTPEALVADGERLALSPFAAFRPVKALLMLAARRLPWRWGVTGSCAYALATGEAVLHEDSDLDLRVCCPSERREALAVWEELCRLLPCRADIQVETPWGAFALREWLHPHGGSGRRVMLKTNTGPVLTDDPWRPVAAVRGRE